MSGSLLIARITNYMASGGLFNPESMQHDSVRDLLMDVRDHLMGPYVQASRAALDTRDETVLLIMEAEYERQRARCLNYMERIAGGSSAEWRYLTRELAAHIVQFLKDAKRA